MAAKCKNLGVPFAKSFANLICIEPSFPFSFLPLPYLSLLLFVLLQHSNAWLGIVTVAPDLFLPKARQRCKWAFPATHQKLQKIELKLLVRGRKGPLAPLHLSTVGDKSSCFCMIQGNHAGSTRTSIFTLCNGG